MTQFYTYLWLRQKDATPYYVGKGTGHRAFTNYGHTVHRPVSGHLILVQNWESEEKALEMEKWWISFYGRKDIGTGSLHNSTEGGERNSGHKHSEEHKKKISKALMGVPKKSDRISSSITKRNKERVWSEEARSRVGKQFKGTTNRLGVKHSPEAKEKMKAAWSKRKLGDDLSRDSNGKFVKRMEVACP